MGKNKSPTGQVEVSTPPTVPKKRAVRTPKVKETDKKVKSKPEKATVVPRHPLDLCAEYVMEHVDDRELSYYKRLATKQNCTPKQAFARAIIELFRVRDSKLDPKNLFNE